MNHSSLLTCLRSNSCTKSKSHNSIHIILITSHQNMEEESLKQSNECEKRFGLIFPFSCIALANIASFTRNEQKIFCLTLTK